MSLMPSKSLKITHASLEELQASEVFYRRFPKESGFTAENIYGPDGKLSWPWHESWNSANEMHSDLCQNMGGGVPIEIINELVRICSAKK